MKYVIFVVMSLVLVLGTPVLVQSILFPLDYNQEQIALLKDTNKDFCFSVVGDLHFGRYKSQPAILKYVLENASVDSDFIIVNGDITNKGEFFQFGEYFEAIKDSKIPVITVKGNHDILMNMDLYNRIFGNSQFNFEYNGYNFIILDSSTWRVDYSELDWLSYKLKDKPAIVVLHHPPLSNPDKLFPELKNAKSVMEVLSSNPPFMVISSHNHSKRKFTQGNTNYIITGSAGGEKDASYETICLETK